MQLALVRITPEAVVTSSFPKMHCIAMHHPGVQCLTINENPSHVVFLHDLITVFVGVGGLDIAASLNLMESS